MEKLTKALQSRLTKDECGDPIIKGKRGDIMAYGLDQGDGKDGYSVVVWRNNGGSVKPAVKELSSFCELEVICQNEAILIMRDIPNKQQAKALRKLLKLPKRRTVSEAQKEASVKRLKQYWFKSSRTSGTV